MIDKSGRHQKAEKIIFFLLAHKWKLNKILIKGFRSNQIFLMIHYEISIPNTVTMVLAIQQLFLEPEWALSQ